MCYNVKRMCIKSSPHREGSKHCDTLLLDKWWYANNILIRVEQKLDNVLVGGYKLEVPSL